MRRKRWHFKNNRLNLWSKVGWLRLCPIFHRAGRGDYQSPEGINAQLAVRLVLSLQFTASHFVITRSVAPLPTRAIDNRPYEFVGCVSLAVFLSSAARRAHGSSAEHAMRDLIASHAPLREGSHTARQNGPKHYPGDPTGRQQGPRQSPTKWVWWGEEEQRND